MKDVWIVARWEFLRSVRSKAFIIATVLVPLIIIVAALVPQLVIKHEKKVLKVVDETGEIYQTMITQLAPQGIEVIRVDLTESEVRDEAGNDKDKTARYLFIPGNFFETREAFFYLRNSATEEEPTVAIGMILDQLANGHEFKAMGLPPEKIAQLEKKVQVTPVPIDQQATSMTDLIVKQAGLVGFAFLVVFASMMAGGILLQGIINEKNDRIVEILLSSISSRALMAGKILGTFFLGLIQMGILGAIAVVILKFVVKISLASLASSNLIYLMIYSLLAFIQIITLYAFLGAIMKEAQSGGQVQPLLGVLPIVPMWFMPLIMSNPFGPAAYILSYIPPCTPMTMLMRIAMAPALPGWEIALSIVELVAFDMLLIYFVARVFKTGLLMYGKAAGFREAWRWFKQATD